MAENTEQVFFTKKHSRLANIAQLAKIIGWIYLVIGLIYAVFSFLEVKDIIWIRLGLPVADYTSLFPEELKYASTSTGKIILTTITNILHPIIYWLVLRAISAGLNMILETDLNYRGAAEDGEELAEGSKPTAMRAIVTETARVLKGTFHKKPTDPAAEEDPDLKYTEGDQPVFYDPKQVLWLDKWLRIAAVISIARYILHALLLMDPGQQIFLSFFTHADSMSILAWIGTVLYSLLNLGVRFMSVFFPMIALGALLKVLMEMEFTSRGVEE
ncbi:hypothetical protein JR338_10895 [Chloroflexota bacterium]|nr:hypothetical protein JR338_10895 [Chloroflexota bacterium]